MASAGCASRGELKTGGDAEPCSGEIHLNGFGAFQKCTVHEIFHSIDLLGGIGLFFFIQGHCQLSTTAALIQKNPDGFYLSVFKKIFNLLLCFFRYTNHGCLLILPRDLPMGKYFNKWEPLSFCLQQCRQ